MTDETTQGELTDKQKLFVEFYLIHMNGTLAAKLAGYKGNANVLAVTAHDNLRNPKIRSAVDEALAERVMGKGEVLARLADQARGDMREFIGKGAESLKKHPGGRLIKKYERTVTTMTLGDNGEERVEEKVKVELYDAQAALVQLGRYLGLFIDRHDLTSGGEPLPAPIVYLPALSDDDASSA
jgi:phage terminase small subunit